MDSTWIYKSAATCYPGGACNFRNQYQATTNANKFANGALARFKAAMTPALVPVMA